MQHVLCPRQVTRFVPANFCPSHILAYAPHPPPLDPARELMSAIEAGQQRRHVASTQMNRESSRSHLIISIIIESTNLQTQSVAKGKLSFVDLAGSER